eukprot:PhM_4_TR2999/c0_g4_i2/m.14330
MIPLSLAGASYIEVLAAIQAALVGSVPFTPPPPTIHTFFNPPPNPAELDVMRAQYFVRIARRAPGAYPDAALLRARLRQAVRNPRMAPVMRHVGPRLDPPPQIPPSCVALLERSSWDASPLRCVLQREFNAQAAADLDVTFTAFPDASRHRARRSPHHTHNAVRDYLFMSFVS